MTNKTCGECKHYIAEMYHCQKNDVIAESFNTCEDFDPKIITNGDVIRQKSNEELAEMLSNPPCFVCSKGDAAGECTDTWRKKDCKGAILERLNAPAESEGEDE